MYLGEWKSNLMHGYGEFFWPDGKKYTGQYDNDKKHGFGLFLWSTYPKIKAYVGYWEDGKQNGVGFMINNKKIMFGNWVNGVKQQTFKGGWEMKKYAKYKNLKFTKFLEQDIELILNLLLETS